MKQRRCSTGSRAQNLRVGLQRTIGYFDALLRDRGEISAETSAAA